MSEAKRIADQLRQALRGPAWHGDSVAEILEGVTDPTARIPGANSIHALVLHMAAWAEIALERVTTGPVPSVTEEQNFPAPGDWQTDVDRLFRSSDRLAAHIEGMSDTELDFVFDSNGQTVYRLLHGVVQHHLYHAGQIALLKKTK